MVDIYKRNDRITFTARVVNSSEANVFVCPYGFGVRFKLIKLSIYNEAGTATSIKFFDHKATGAPSDPPSQGDSTTPLFTKSVATVAHTNIGMNDIEEFTFNQGMAVVASQGTVVITATVIEV